MVRRILLALGLGSLVGLLVGCQPSTIVESPSPDGRSIALIKSHFAFDGPSHSLWLAGAAGEVLLERLGEDTHWASDVAWSQDSELVGFLVRDDQVLVYDRDRGRLVADIEVPDHTTSLRSLVVEDGAVKVRFEGCEAGPNGSTDCEALARR